MTQLSVPALLPSAQRRPRGSAAESNLIQFCVGVVFRGIRLQRRASSPRGHKRASWRRHQCLEVVANALSYSAQGEPRISDYSSHGFARARMYGCASAIITATTKGPKAHEIWTSRNLIGAFWPDDEIRRETRSNPFGMAGTPQLRSVYRSVCSRSFANPTHSATWVAIGVSLGGQFKGGPIRSRRGPGTPKGSGMTS